APRPDRRARQRPRRPRGGAAPHLRRVRARPRRLAEPRRRLRPRARHRARHRPRPLRPGRARGEPRGRLDLPRDPAAPHPRPARRRVRAGRDLNRDVLIVEDDEAIAAGLALNLQIEGYGPTHVSDGESALLRTTERHFAIILLDISLPGKSGLDVL